MNARGVTKGQLEQAAREVGVELYNLREAGKTERAGWAFTLKTGKATSPKERAKYRRVSKLTSYRDGKRHTVPGAVCWHGHRDFFRALYKLAPQARIKTAMAVYLNARHFEELHPDTFWMGGERMGAAMVPASDLCVCASVGA